MLSREELQREASSAGFQPESFEKVLRLIELLDALRSHPFLKPRIALKGGTALNLFVFDVPRLSVDIDLNYIGAADRETMLAERPKIDEAIQAVCGRLGIQVKRVPSDHAGGKWRLSYQSALGRPATLELDMNYMLRMPLWPVVTSTSRSVGSFKASDIPVVDVHELAAGKLAALLSRQASRDIFDAHRLLTEIPFDRDRLRLAFVVYGGCSRKDWRTVRVSDAGMDEKEAGQQLLPLLRSGQIPAKKDVGAWAAKLVQECRDKLSVVLPLTRTEVDFLSRLNDKGEIVADLLTVDPRLQTLIAAHPMLNWKAHNVREHRSKR